MEYAFVGLSCLTIYPIALGQENTPVPFQARRRQIACEVDFRALDAERLSHDMLRMIWGVIARSINAA